MKVTRILISDTPPALQKLCKAAGFLRADLWRRYGALGTLGRSPTEIRAEIVKHGLYDSLPLDGTIRAETTRDIINSILASKEAAKKRVRKSIANRTDDREERKHLYRLLKTDSWLSDGFLHRQMRKQFPHGRSVVANQFVVRSDRHFSEIVDGHLQITIKIAKKYGSNIVLTTTSSGKNVTLSGSNLRIVVREKNTEVHYTTEKSTGRPCGTETLGVDKGFTEAFTDSDGVRYGSEFGLIISEHTQRVTRTNKQRNQLAALEKEHRKEGRTQKADRIKNNNLGSKKQEKRNTETRQKLRTIAFKAAHALVDNATTVVSEDLTWSTKSKTKDRRLNRKLNAWAKGVLAEALESVCKQRNAKLVLVNGAYTSQMDSITGLLQGKRVGDKFYRINGDVIQADHNAAMNVLARLEDREISRFTPYKQVREILLARSPAQLSVKRLELGAHARQPSADKPSQVNGWISSNLTLPVFTNMTYQLRHLTLSQPDAY